MMIFVVKRELCNACEECVAICPVGAISIRGGSAAINVNKCLGCGACLRECQEDAIRMLRIKNGNASGVREHEGGTASE